MHLQHVRSRLDDDALRRPAAAPQRPRQPGGAGDFRDLRALDREGLVGAVEGVDRGEQPELRPAPAGAVFEPRDRGAVVNGEPIPVAVEDAFETRPFHRIVTSASACWPKRAPSTVRSAPIRARRTGRPVIGRTTKSVWCLAERGDVHGDIGRLGGPTDGNGQTDRGLGVAPERVPNVHAQRHLLAGPDLGAIWLDPGPEPARPEVDVVEWQQLAVEARQLGAGPVEFARDIRR